MSCKDLSRRLRKLEARTRLASLGARERAMTYTLRSHGAELEPHDLGDGYDEQDFCADCDSVARCRAALDSERRQREQHALMRRLYRKLERRGIDPYIDGQG